MLCVCAAGRLHQAGRASGPLYRLLDAQAAACLRSFTPAEAAMYLSSLARAGALRKEQLEAFQPAIARMGRGLGGQQVAKLLWALATAGPAVAGPAADALIKQLSARAQVCSSPAVPRAIARGFRWRAAPLCIALPCSLPRAIRSLTHHSEHHTPHAVAT